MSLGGDRWRVMGAGLAADLTYDFFGIGGEPDRAIPLTQNVDFVMVEGLRRVSDGLFLGLRAQFSQTATGIDIPEDLLPPGVSPGDLTLDLDLNALVPRLVYDTRDNQFFPRDGWQIEGDAAIARDAIGSDVDYELYKGFANRYLPLTDRGVLALRVAAQYASSETPFFLYPAFGAESDLRGYQTGTYRDQFLFATQAEWRQSLSERWRAVAFAGIGTVAPDAFDWGPSLPSYGFGLRWKVAPKNDLSLRFDLAWGRGDSEFYVSIGEAF
jgi:outer membrane protein assembly factor BamA